MTQPAKAQEPSMEEILASIRRIIADDDPSSSPPAAAEPPHLVATPPRPPAPPPTSAAAAPPPRPAPAPEPPAPRMPAEAMFNEPAPSVRAAEPAPEVFELTEAMTAPAPALVESFRTIDGQTMFEDTSEEDFPEAAPLDARTPFQQQLERTLISSTTSAAVDSAFNSLAHTVLVQNARTLEDLVREMLRPMLKSWLDDNLPGLVERLVRAEIERVSRGRG